LIIHSGLARNLKETYWGTKKKQKGFAGMKGRKEWMCHKKPEAKKSLFIY
jgi:hypothetical protein